jgi:ABC-type nitrate/sulfonate/bicarbonate transport system substrate-binding protein
VAGQIIPDLQAEAARNPDIADAMQKALREGQQGVASGIVAAAAARGEVREGIDQELALDLVSAVAIQGLPAPDTGSLEGDLRLLYEVSSRALRHPVAGQIIPDLQAEAARNPDIADAMQKALREGQQGVASGIVAAAAARGEVREGIDQELALDLMSGPLYWRAVVVRGPKLPKGYLASLARATAAALRAL